MTWLADVQQGRPDEKQTAKLQEKRDGLVVKIKLLNQQTGMHKSNAGREGHLEDLKELAKQVNSIDRKLGRTS